MSTNATCCNSLGTTGLVALASPALVMEPSPLASGLVFAIAGFGFTSGFAIDSAFGGSLDVAFGGGLVPHLLAFEGFADLL